MSKSCQLNVYHRVQIRNRNSKSEMLIQSETALNAGETGNQSMATHQREHKDARYFWIPEQVQDEDFRIKEEKNRAQILERGQSLLQYCNFIQIARLVLNKATDPTLHHKMKADEVYDVFGGRVATPI